MRNFSFFFIFLGSFLAALFPATATLAQGTVPFFKCDSVAVTHEGNISSASTSIVLKILNVAGIGTAPTAANWPLPMTSPRTSAGGQSFSLKNMGQIFGIAHNAAADLFVAASSSYNSNAWGGINTKITTNVPQNSGSIYRINNSGIIEFAELPNAGSGLGNLAYDQPHNMLLATNFHDGKIYGFNATTGVQVFVFDPNFDGLSYPAAAANFVKLGQRPWGVAAFGSNASNVVLYYGRWTEDTGRPQAAASNQIWSVRINTAGTGVVGGTETLIWTIPPVTGTYSNPPADLEISTDGLRMLIAERSMYSDEQPYAHQSRVLELTRPSASSTLWTPQPIAKFGIGASSGNNATGGTDFGEYEIKPSGNVLKNCNASVWATSDFINFAAANYVYGIQILAATGGNVSNSKWIDNDNMLASYDKTQTGDVDYRRCMQCGPPAGSDCCQMYRPAPSDSVCCKAGILRAIEPGCTVQKVQYTVIGGVIQNFTSNCTINSPFSYAGTTSGTVTFTGVCNLANLWANLTATSATGNVTVNWVITFTNGQTCQITSQVKNCPHPLIECDKFAFKQCVCAPAALSYIDVHITNQAIPNSPICKVKIVKYDPANNVQTTYWSAGAVVTPAATPFAAPFTLIPSSGPSLNILTGGIVNAQLYFPTSTFSGSITVTAYHCNGDSCVKSWKPRTWIESDPTLVNAAVAKNVKPAYDKIFAAGFQVQQPTGSGFIPPVKYASISVAEPNSPAIVVAVTGAEMFPDRSNPTIRKAPGTIQHAAQAAKNVMWEFKEPLQMSPGSASAILHVIFANQVPKLVSYTLYDEEGGIIRTATIEVTQFKTTEATDRSDYPAESASPSFLLLSGAPNPADEHFHLLYSLNTPETISFHVFDLDGRLIETISAGTQTEGNHEQSLETAHLPSGIYMIRMYTADKRASSPLKMVVAH